MYSFFNLFFLQFVIAVDCSLDFGLEDDKILGISLKFQGEFRKQCVLKPLSFSHLICE